MKIKSIRIQNYRGFQDETINLNRYSCFVGPNGAGKSTILSALNVFFKEQATTDVSKLTDEDYFNKNTKLPIKITVTFDELNQKAQDELAAYVRQNELTVTVEAIFDEKQGYGQVKHFGNRLGMVQFRAFFEAEKSGAKAPELNALYDQLKKQYSELPAARSKEDKAEALRVYESAHPIDCALIPSEDNFYGINSTGKIASFVQWVFVPAVKDACDEGQEARNTAFGKLIARAVRARSNFDTEIDGLRTETLTKYREILDRNQVGLTEVSQSLQRRLESWAHPNVRLGMEWLSDPNKSVTVQTPIAGIKTGEGDFLGSLARMGHGLQRSYLLALLQELACSESPDAPTLLLGCEEPELYQHPPQARHLSDVLNKLSESNNQILITTHSPLFVSGEGFENTKLVRKTNNNTGANVKSLYFQSLCTRIRTAMGENNQRRIEGLIAKIHQTLQPGISEMFFTRVPILVEGLEDVSYITTHLYISGQWSEFRRLGCHIIPVNGKSNLIQPIAIANELDFPVFVVFDADGDTPNPDNRVKHERDNKALQTLMGAIQMPFPSTNIWSTNHAIWVNNIADAVKADFGENYNRVVEAARIHYAQEGGLEKNDLLIADWLTAAHDEGLSSGTLNRLCESILTFARSV